MLLDAAAFAPTNRLDLAAWHPDFVPLSFYKMFGYPTGVGALIAPQAGAGHAAPALVRRRHHHARLGAGRGWHYLAPGRGRVRGRHRRLPRTCRPSTSAATPRAAWASTRSTTRVSALTGWLLERLAELRHSNGAPMVQRLRPVGHATRAARTDRLLSAGPGRARCTTWIAIEELAGRRGISIRTGCFCNPGDGEVALGLSRNELTRCFRRARRRMSYEDFSRLHRRQGDRRGARVVGPGLELRRRRSLPRPRRGAGEVAAPG